ncbi:MAG: hypothetical protein GY714_03295 [Desulfobacterales bacterium]|nr:hypothetical protein [Desulfobacterales bacterium]
MFKKLLLIICILFTSEVFGASFTTVEVFQNQVNSHISERMGDLINKPKNSNVRFFKLNFDLLLGNEPFEIELIRGSKLQFEKDDLTIRTFDSYSWRGKIKGNINSRAIFAVEGQDLSGNITIDSMLFEIRPMGDGIHSISEIEKTFLKNEAESLILPKPLSSIEKDFQTFKDDGSTIDVMIAYTQDVKNRYSNITTLMQLAVDNTNQYYINSGIVQRVRLVKTMLVSYVESGDPSTDLTRLQSSSDNYLNEIHPVRDTYGADIVTLCVSRMDGACGIGYMMTPELQSIFAAGAFNVVDVDCGSLTYAHELGHNMGAHHDAAQPGTGWGSYSKGFVDSDNNFKTIMAYGNETRVGYFSDDTIKYGNNPVGSDIADNVRTLNETRNIVANFRSSTAAGSSSSSSGSGGSGSSGSCFIGLIKDQNNLKGVFSLFLSILFLPFLIYVISGRKN